MKFSSAVAAFGIVNAALAVPAAVNKYHEGFPSGLPSELPSGVSPTPAGGFPFATGSFPVTPSATILPTQAVPAVKIPGEPPVKRDFTSGSFPATPSATGLSTQAVPAGKVPGDKSVRHLDSVVRRNLDARDSADDWPAGYSSGFPSATGGFAAPTSGVPAATATPSGTY
ncbi:hypothetical protein M432DRAFT_590539 [Thermoascus aurantiacus ATCC 26904]